MMRGVRSAWLAGLALAITLFLPGSAHAQFATAPGFTAGTAGAACSSGTQAFAWPDANGYALNCVSGTWQPASTSNGAAGSNAQVQYNGGSGALAGSSNLTWSNSTGQLGIGTATPQSALHVYAGELQVGSSGAACSAANAGALRYANSKLQYCNGAGWVFTN